MVVGTLRILPLPDRRVVVLEVSEGIELIERSRNPGDTTAGR